MKRTRSMLLAAAAGALVFSATTALAGSGVGGTFNLGQTNAVDATSALNGTTATQLSVQNASNASGAVSILGLISSASPGANSAALRGQNKGTGAAGYGVWGSQAGSGTGVYGTSATGIGLFGKHTASTGSAPAVKGESASASAAALLGLNTAGGPALSLLVNAGKAPFTVNSAVKVTNLNADFLDGLDSGALQKRVSGGCASGQAVRVVNADGTVSCEPVGLSGAWGLNGNGGTAAGSVLGTTDSKPLVLETNGSEVVRLTEGGKVGIGTSAPAGKLDVSAGVSNDPVGVSIFGRIESQGFGGLSAAVEGDNASTSNIGIGVAGLHHGSGWGVYGAAPNGSGVVGRHTATTGTEPGALGMTDSTAPGAVGTLGQINGAGATDSSGVKGVNNGAGYGVYGTTSSTTGFSAGVKGVGGTCGFCVGVYGSVPGNGIGVLGETPTGVNGAWGVEGIGSFDGIGVRGKAGSSGSGVTGVGGNGGSFSSSVSNGTGVVGTVSGAGHGVRGEAGAGGYGVVGKNTSSGVGVYGETQTGLAGKFVGNVDIDGYLRLKVSSSLPPPSGCDEDSEAGRLYVQILESGNGQSSNDVWVCFGSLSGWLRLRL